MKIGYARVSTCEQNLETQKQALQAVGCARIFTDDGVSAVDRNRPGFEAAMKALRPGDTFVIWKLDRAFRSTVQAIVHLDELRARGIELQMVTSSIDTSTPEGRLFYIHLANFAEFERELVRVRTKEAMALWKSRGKHMGRPPKLTPDQIELARAMLKSPAESYRTVSRRLGVDRSTLYRRIKALERQEQLGD